jgi:hypothetical protein
LRQATSGGITTEPVLKGIQGWRVDLSQRGEVLFTNDQGQPELFHMGTTKRVKLPSGGSQLSHFSGGIHTPFFRSDDKAVILPGGGFGVILPLDYTTDRSEFK